MRIVREQSTRWCWCCIDPKPRAPSVWINKEPPACPLHTRGPRDDDEDDSSSSSSRCYTHSHSSTAAATTTTTGASEAYLASMPPQLSYIGERAEHVIFILIKSWEHNLIIIV